MTRPTHLHLTAETLMAARDRLLITLPDLSDDSACTTLDTLRGQMATWLCESPRERETAKQMLGWLVHLDNLDDHARRRDFSTVYDSINGGD